MMEESAATKSLSGEAVFKLYDTYGFPYELTEEIALEKGYSIDRQGFDAAMKEQQERARAARTKVSAKVAVPDTTKLDQTKLINDETATTATVVMLGKDGVEVEHADMGEEVTVIVDTNPFHAEGGGQVGDTGVLKGVAGTAKVTNAKALPNGLVYLIVTVQDGTIKTGDTVDTLVDTDRNLALARNHTATHLLQAALRKVLGNHVNQAGSLVMPDYLRFDFTHFSPVTEEELERVEGLVNDEILKNIPVTIESMSLEDAKNQVPWPCLAKNMAMSSAWFPLMILAVNSAVVPMLPIRLSSVRSASFRKRVQAQVFAVLKRLQVEKHWLFPKRSTPHW